MHPPATSPRLRAIGLAGLGALILSTSACGSADPSTDSSSGSSAGTASTTAAASPGAAPSGTAEEEQQRLEAKVVANAAPKDLTWLHPDAPSSWTRLKTEAGTLQWQPASSACVITLAQPAGLGTAKAPTSQQVVDKTVSQVARTVPGTPEPTVVKWGTQTVRARVTDLDATVSVTVAARRVRFTPQLEGLFYGYRAGDFALDLIVVCGKAQYDDVTGTSAFRSFTQGLTVTTSY